MSRNDKIVRLLALATIGTISLLVFSAVNGFAAYSDFRRLVNQDTRLVILSGRVVLLDEILTNAARMAAVTGSEVWKERYDQHASLLDDVLREMRRLTSSRGDQQFLAQVIGANDDLVRIESESFRAVRLGNAEQAKLLLFSAQYLQHKKEYEVGIRSLFSSLRTRASRQVERAWNRTVLGAIVGGVCLVLSILVLSVAVALARGEQALQAQFGALNRRRTLDRLAQGIAHELSQPLTAVSQFARASRTFLDQGEVGRPLKESIEGADRQACRALSIVQNLRDYSRTQTLGFEIVSVNELVSAGVQLVQGEAKARKVSLGVEYSATDFSTRGIRVELEQVIVNILINALEASAETAGPRRVTVKAWHESGSAFIEVFDTGPGFPADVADRLTEAFFTTKSGGLGLGLTISRDIVQAHGGNLRVTSGRDGTRVTIELPLEARDS